MKIDSSSIGMESMRKFQSAKTTVRRFKLAAYQGEDTQDNTAMDNTLEEEAQELGQRGSSLQEWEARFRHTTGRVHMRTSSETTAVNIREMTIRYIFDLLFSNKRSRFDEWMNNQPVNYVEESVSWEREETSFSTVGKVRTSDGREINFRVNVGMSREFLQTFRQELRFNAGAMCDPLVINLDTDVATLSDQKFYFDIDADGEKDEISRLGMGSGFLALDKNNDGIINDGKELFGTKSGDGFRDLAAYDDDGNGWIDENDAIWSKLKIWCMDENGNSQLYRLAEKGVGAICLQNVSTDFTLQGMDAAKGAIRRSGIFLYENGNVGTVQHVDFAK